LCGARVLVVAVRGYGMPIARTVLKHVRMAGTGCKVSAEQCQFSTAAALQPVSQKVTGEQVLGRHAGSAAAHVGVRHVERGRRVAGVAARCGMSFRCCAWRAHSQIHGTGLGQRGAAGGLPHPDIACLCCTTHVLSTDLHSNAPYLRQPACTATPMIMQEKLRCVQMAWWGRTGWVVNAYLFVPQSCGALRGSDTAISLASATQGRRMCGRCPRPAERCWTPGWPPRAAPPRTASLRTCCMG
jgi:hypothetical protein